MKCQRHTAVFLLTTTVLALFANLYARVTEVPPMVKYQYGFPCTWSEGIYSYYSIQLTESGQAKDPSRWYFVQNDRFVGTYYYGLAVVINGLFWVSSVWMCWILLQIASSAIQRRADATR